MLKNAKLFLTLTFLLLLISSFTLQAQVKDSPGSSDHPLISRYEGFNIVQYEEKEFEKYQVPTSIGRKGKLDKAIDVEGKITKIMYRIASAEKPSLFQVVRNYEEAFKAKNAEEVFKCYDLECGRSSDDIITVLTIQGVMLNEFMRFGKHATQIYNFSKGEKNYYAAFYFREEKNQIMYELHVIELEAMVLDKVSLGDIQQGMQDEGKMAFYGIYFDVGKSVILPESEEVLGTIKEYLAGKAQQKFFIVGHTDNTGSYENNLKLSQARADAVVEWLKSNGVKTDNLNAVGVGPVAPMSTNETEMGKSRNRRVELVMQ